MELNQQDNPQADFNIQETIQTPEPQDKPRRTAIWVAGIAGLILLLGAAAFMAMRLGLLGGASMQGPVIGGAPGTTGMGIRVNMTPAPELPTTPPDLVGMFSRWEGDRLFLKQMTGVEGPSEQTGSGASEGFNSVDPVTGPEIEVVITNETKIYRDVTDIPQPSQGQEQTFDMQQKLELLDSLDGLTSDNSLRVWGEKRGDRVIAQVILYNQMIVFSN